MKFKVGDLVCYKYFKDEYYRLILGYDKDGNYKVYYINNFLNKEKIGFERYDNMLYDIKKVAP